ncbi:shikimate dehydrogenase [Paenibacillus melissococcoides]|uniref:Shikimate dehydrogenase (NADP(+)) n=1 Tax=Paenibacillus melissococcoides TaxID=2912268 RepID=A0ABM9G726_9BACL|nr:MULTISPECIES: shikimate dehydrogenase [Paenibacillus]GIO79392.1 shikimate dehydrogenase (NADP(+)) [Paenibacillus dendritiformis]CAH8247425.1 shikimate dehydrogenase [Paenibacillus melissococcoides]CAH8705183.1 shikimate dehydrogenase [Paenibacillus melissococcoides]CAH8708406.1 shikimate dehydrogenase [Paenibacillus melissococcoides]
MVRNDVAGAMRPPAGIDSSTAVFAVIGDPIKHSKSPLMHNAALRELGLNAVYTAFRVAPEQLGQAVQGMRALGIGGMNVTIPHKEAVMAHLDEVDESASVIGAVNTIVNRNGRLIGYNTDGLGFVRSLQEEMISDLRQSRILLIGAGGAARGIAYALLKAGCRRLHIANRTLARAEALARDLSAFGTVAAVQLGERPAIGAHEADIVIHTTSVGMHPDVEAVPFDPDWLRPDMIVSDIVYNPLETALLREAGKRGCRTHSGLGMFVYQGAIALELWTGAAAPAALMREQVWNTLSHE